MAGTPQKGICHVCGEVKELTFEHTPPKALGNKYQTHVYSGIDLIKSQNAPWDFNGLRFEKRPRGMGGYTLCKEHNDFTGQKYVPALKSLYDQLYAQNVIPFYASGMNLHWRVKLQIKPLNLTKEVLTMLLCVSGEGFGKSYNSILRKLILHPEKKIESGFPHHLYMFLSKASLQRSFGPMAVARTDYKKPLVFCGVDAYPISFQMSIDSEHLRHSYLDITDWLKYEYDQEIGIDISLPMYEVNTLFPVDHRTKNEILQGMKRLGQ